MRIRKWQIKVYNQNGNGFFIVMRHTQWTGQKYYVENTLSPYLVLHTEERRERSEGCKGLDWTWNEQQLEYEEYLEIDKYNPDSHQCNAVGYYNLHSDITCCIWKAKEGIWSYWSEMSKKLEPWVAGELLFLLLLYAVVLCQPDGNATFPFSFDK